MNNQNTSQNQMIPKIDDILNQNSLTNLPTEDDDEGTFDSNSEYYSNFRKDLINSIDSKIETEEDAEPENTVEEDEEMTEEEFEQFFNKQAEMSTLMPSTVSHQPETSQPEVQHTIDQPVQTTPQDQQQVPQRPQISVEERKKESIQIHNQLLRKIKDIYPVRSKLKPRALIKVYSISSDMIKQYVKTKVKHFVPNCFTNTIVSFVKAPKSKTKGYASARISFSDKVISEACRAKNFYERLGEDDNVTFVPSIYKNIIEKFRYNKGEIDRILSNYKALSSLEDNFGIDEQFLNDIKLYIRPQRIQIDSRNSMIVFSARVESIIQDMLTNPKTGIVDGVIEIKEIYVNRNVVHFTVYVHPTQMPIENNDMVRALIENSSSSIKFY